MAGKRAILNKSQPFHISEKKGIGQGSNEITSTGRGGFGAVHMVLICSGLRALGLSTSVYPSAL